MKLYITRLCPKSNEKYQSGLVADITKADIANTSKLPQDDLQSIANPKLKATIEQYYVVKDKVVVIDKVTKDKVVKDKIKKQSKTSVSRVLITFLISGIVNYLLLVSIGSKKACAHV